MLNAHTDASGNLCACSRICSRNGWNEISGACYECRCGSCWPRPVYWTQSCFLGPENFLINALHIVDDQGQWERSLDYLSEKLELNVRKVFPYGAIVAMLSKTQHLLYNKGKWVGIEVSITVNDTFFHGLGWVAYVLQFFYNFAL